jgi:hypothetical protein
MDLLGSLMWIEAMAMKRLPLTQEQFDQLPVADHWQIDEVPRELWDRIPGLQRLQDTFAIMGSGSVSDPGLLNGIMSIAGIDVLVNEPNPMAGEPPGNAYHYVFQKTNHAGFPYIMHGPYISETVVPHWFDAPDLERYWGGGANA